MVRTGNLQHIGHVFRPFIEQGTSQCWFERKIFRVEEHEWQLEISVKDITEHETIDVDPCTAAPIGNTKLSGISTT